MALASRRGRSGRTGAQGDRKILSISERSGAGQTMKLCNNVLSAAGSAATSESMVMGVKAGLNPRIMLDVINASSGRSTATERNFPTPSCPAPSIRVLPPA